jgi:hypothetical protein
MGWMLAVVKRSSDEPVVYRVNESETVEVSETVFADDVSLYQRSLNSMQTIVDACCALLWFHRHALQHWKMSVDGKYGHRQPLASGGCMWRSGFRWGDGA